MYKVLNLSTGYYLGFGDFTKYETKIKIFKKYEDAKYAAGKWSTLYRMEIYPHE